MRRTFLATLALVIVAVFAVSPLPWSVSARHWLALELTQRGFLPTAEVVYRTLAWNGDALGQNNLGVLIQVEARRQTHFASRRLAIAQARELYENAFSKGLRVAAYNAGMLNFSADSNTDAYANAKHFLSHAATPDDLQARIAYAQHLDVFVPEDLQLKHQLLEQLQTSGNPIAFLEWVNLTGFMGGPAPDDNAFRAAAATGDFFAIEALAYELWNRPDDTGWLDVAAQAAEMGSIWSQSRLGSGYKYGHYGLPVDPAAAAYWLEMAATASNERRADPLSPIFAGDGFRSRQVRYWPSEPHNVQVSAAYELAGLYLSGTGVDKDLERARELLQEPARIDWGDARQMLADLNEQR